MPEINGLQLSEKIRKSYSPDQLPIIMITTQSDLQDVEAAKGAGIDVVLHKPFTDEELRNTIDKAAGV